VMRWLMRRPRSDCRARLRPDSLETWSMTDHAGTLIDGRLACDDSDLTRLGPLTERSQRS